MTLKQAHNIKMIVIGASAGGVEALCKILPAFKMGADLTCAVVLHLPPRSRNLLPTLVAPESEFQIKEAEAGEKILPNTIYIAPSDYHLCLEPNETLSLSSEEPVHYSRPSIDILFESAAYAYGKSLVGIILTGSSSDGALGLRTIKEMGGLTVVQDPKNASFPVMPQAALNLFEPICILTIDEIVNFVTSVSKKGKHHG